MSNQYSRDLVKISVGKILQTIGWHSINTTPLEILTDVLQQYLSQIAKATNDYANEFGFIEPNLDHLGLAFRDFQVNLSDLEEYVTYVNVGNGLSSVPSYPVRKEDHLNFLKPGSKEVVTRPVHIHEHLPPMYPLLETAENDSDTVVKKEEADLLPSNENFSPIFKKPAEIPEGDAFKRPRLLMEEEGRPTREISSVMMTTSGFLSPAREGKLPESRTPLATIELTQPPPNYVTSCQSGEVAKKLTKPLKKVEKKRAGKELFKPDVAVKRPQSMKDVVKHIQMKAANNPVAPDNKAFKINKALAAALEKTEKLNTTITPIPMKPPPPFLHNNAERVHKLLTEPDRKKLNILKKISNVKNEKAEIKQPKVKEEVNLVVSRESSPDLIIDETADIAKVHHITNDITIELIQCPPASEGRKRPYSDNEPPLELPLTPKTPDILSRSPPMKEKRRRKYKTNANRKVEKFPPLATVMEPGLMDMELERPKTPDAHLMMKPDPMPMVNPMPYQFYPNFGCPGLIPPLNNPLYNPLKFPLFGQVPQYIHPNLPMNFMQPQKIDEPPPKVIEKRVTPEPEPLPLKSDKKLKEHKKEKRDKIKKKNKKDRVKNKAEKKKLKEERKDKIKKEKKEKRKEKEVRENEISVPKLTLKLGSASPCSDTQERKLNIKPVVKKEVEDEVTSTVDVQKENSPELAKISALVTGQPKHRAPNPLPVVSSTSNDNFPTSSTDSFHNMMKKSMFKPIPKIRTQKIRKDPCDLETSNTTPPSKYLTNTSYSTPIKRKKWFVGARRKFEEDTVKEETAPVSIVVPSRAGPGPGRPRIHPIKQKPAKVNKRQVPVKDSEGNEVWICPACGIQDDGSPMIGCDDCDAWYHWVCVGIQIAPHDNEDWYCRHCIVKKQEVLQTDKKKKRKKREKKNITID